MPTVVYVAGLSHSGSTLLHMMLASHPRAVGLGEAFKTLAPGPSGLARSRSRRCTCGKAMEDCPFWGHAAARVPSGDDASFVLRDRLPESSRKSGRWNDCRWSRRFEPGWSYRAGRSPGTIARARERSPSA